MGSLTWEADRETLGLAKLIVIMKEERKKQLEEIFAKHDKDANGKLCVKELQDAFLALKNDLYEDEDKDELSADDMESAKDIGFCETLIASVDKIGDNTVTCEEFINLIDEEYGYDDDLKTELKYDLKIKNLVKHADKDGDGLLCAGELRTMLMKMDPEDDDHDDDLKTAYVNRIIRMFAQDSTRKIKPEEFISYMIDDRENEKDPKEDAKRMFKMFDTDQDGYISKKEIAGYLHHLWGGGNDGFLNMQAEGWIRDLDGDEDGKLNFEEFTAILEMCGS